MKDFRGSDIGGGGGFLALFTKNGMISYVQKLIAAEII